jgi:dTDP-4-amino-4,6-dideoxygalactose transaminase
LGDLGCFSFHPRKAITTGEGGLVVTDNAEWAERLRQLRNHGMRVVDGSYRFEHAGLNYRMTDFQGALGTVQFDRLEGIISRRAELAQLYTQALMNVPGITCPREVAGSRHVWQSYVVLLDEIFPRNRFIQVMRERGVETAIGTYAVSALDYYRPRGLNLTCSLQAYRQSLSLPLHTRMDEEDVELIVNHLLDLTRLFAGA